MTVTPRLGMTLPATTDTYDIAVANGNMTLVDAAVGIVFCTFSTRPSVPYANQHIYETDTGNRLARNTANTAWIPLSGYRVADAAARTALGTLPEGFQIYRMDRDWIEIYNGTSWQVQGVAICATSADLANIPSPVNGQLATTIDSGTTWQRQAGAWIVVGGQMVSDIQNPAGSTGSNSYVSALTGAGSAACGVVFTAPPSGAVLILNNCQLSPTAGNGFCTIRVRVGSTIGAGADVVSVLDDNAVITNVAAVVDRKGVSTPVPVLTPGILYNVQQFFKLDMTGTLNTTRKTLTVIPQ